MQSTTHRHILGIVMVLTIAIFMTLSTHVSAQERGGQPQLSPRLQERIINLSSNIQERTEAAIKRFDNIVVRIDSRLVKMEAAGTDITLATERFNEGKASLQNAEDALATLGSARAVISSADPRAGFQAISATFKEIRSALQATRSALVDTVRIMKEQAGTE